jgi:putative ABC transport system permease protein
VDIVQILGDEGVSDATLQSEIERRLPEGTRVGRPVTQTPLVEETLQSTNQGLRLATAFSLLLATFIILNTFLMNVTERRGQLAILRAIGATRGQISRLVLGESLVLGSLGTALGIFAGIAGGRLLTKTLDGLLLTSLPSPNLTLDCILLAVVFGVGISLLGAWLPARRAARLSPLEGISGIVREDMEGSSPRFTVAGGLLIAASGAVIGISISGWLPIEAAILGAVFLLVGIVLVMPAVLDLLLWLFARALAPWMRIEVRLAHRQIPRYHARSALTVGVLFIASSTGIGIANSVLDSMQDVRDWYRRSIVGDFFIRAMMPDMATGMSADLPEALGEEIRAVPGIRNIDTVRFVQATAADQPVVVIVRDFTADAQVYFNLKSGSPDQVRSQLLGGEVVIGTVLAQRTGLRRGDAISVETLKGPKEFRIAGLANEYLVAGLAVYMERRIAREWLGVEGVDGYVIQAEPQARAEVQSQLQALCDKHGVLLHSFADISRLIDRMMIEVDACLWGILALSFVVAAFGVVNTLAMNVLEQTRQFALLRVIAMTRWQVRRTIFSQAAFLGIAGLGPGTLAGVLAAYLIHLATMPATGHPVEFGLRPVLLVSSFAGALLLVLAAAGLPAERAARLELVKALQYE